MVAKSKIIYFIEFFWLLSLLILACMVYLNHELVGTFFNSDWVMFPRFIQDIFLGHGHYRDWVISPAPHFFPDMFIFTPFFLLIKSIYLQFLISILIMIILTYLAVKLIYSQFFSVKQTIIFSMAATSSLFILALKLFYPYVLALVPAVHVGEFIVGLFLIGIQIKMINKEKLDFISYILCGISGVTAFAAGASDLLFVIQFSGPIFLAYSFLFIKRYMKFYKVLLLASLAIFPAMLGICLTKFLVPKNILLSYLGHPSITKISFSNLGIQLESLTNIFKSINSLIKILFFIFYTNVTFFMAVILFNRINKKHKFYLDKKIIFLNLFISFSTLCSLLSAILLANSYQSNVTDRYIISVYFFPFLFFFFILYYFNNYVLVSKIFTYLVFFIFLYILLGIYKLYQKPGFKLHSDYYPQDVRCIDEALHKYGHHGIAQFWDANVITTLSKENVQIVPVNPDLTPFYWAINKNNFNNKISFIVVDSSGVIILNKNLIYAIYGVPEKEIVCFNRKILIYNKENLKIITAHI